MLTKKYGQTNALMAIIVMTKTMLDMWLWDPFHNRSGVIVSWEIVWANSYVLSCNKTTYIVSKRNSIEKETFEIIYCTRWFFYKVWITQYGLSKFVLADN